MFPCGGSQDMPSLVKSESGNRPIAISSLYDPSTLLDVRRDSARVHGSTIARRKLGIELHFFANSAGHNSQDSRFGDPAIFWTLESSQA